MKRGLSLLLLLFASGCVATAAVRFPPDVAQALADHPMRRLTTQSLYVYYPEGRGDEARRVAERIEGCVAGLRQSTTIHNGVSGARMVVILPEVPFNNAFVAPMVVGYDDVAVVPSLNTWDFQTELGIPPDPSYIACHEITHYVHSRQVTGFWGELDTIFGDVLTPQVGLDAWFWEGLATYEETHFQPGVGRMAWPMWQGYFHAGVAGQGVSGGDLSEYNRAFHFGNHYLYGSHFIEFLVERYGEKKLWQLIGLQGDSWFFFLAINWRFYDIYGRSLSSLIDEFSEWTRHEFPARARPAEQTRVRGLGEDARYARAPGGREAIVVSDRDRSAELWIYEADGRRLRQRLLNQILPWRQLAQADPVYTSGLSFTADGKTLYFAVVDAGLVEQEVRLMRYDVEADTLTVVRTIGGPGGAVSPDGKLFYFALVDGDRHHLAALDLASGVVRVVHASAPRQYMGAIRPSPDGTRLAVSVFDGVKFTVWIVDAKSGAKLAEVPGAASAVDASWEDAHRIVYLADVAKTFQVFVLDVDAVGGVPEQVTHVPYLAFAPQAAGGKLRFLDREGWSWQLDEQVLPAPLPPPAPPPPPPAPEVLPPPAEDAVPPAAPTVTIVTTPAPPIPPAPPVAPAVATAAAATLVVASDEPYSVLDHLFFPQLRSITLGGSPDQLSYGLSLGGGDRLAFHRWALTALFQPKTDWISGTFGYANSQLAPWFIVASGHALHWGEKYSSQSKRLDYERLELGGTLEVTRAWGGLDLGFGAIASHEASRFIPDGDYTNPWGSRYAVGPTATLAYTGADGSSYAGAQRLFLARLDATLYPAPLNIYNDNIDDVRGEVRWRFAPPLSRRHHLELRGRARALLGEKAYQGYGLLQVGGEPDVAAIGHDGSLNPDPDPAPLADDLAPGISFYEALRGFEDYTLHTGRMVFADVNYTYPLIIDYGFATSLYLFPAFFVRQLDLEIFGDAAWDLGKDVPPPPMPDEPIPPTPPDRRLHGAAGVALTLKTVFWRVPVGLKYQIARRFTDDDSIAQELGLTLSF